MAGGRWSPPRIRILDRLHGLLRDLVAGGAPTDLTADKAAALLRGLRPATATVACRRELARDLLSDLRRVDARLTDNKARRVWHHPARQRPLGEGIARCHRWSGSGSSL